MPQHYTNLGRSLGQALSEGVGGDGRAYEMGQNEGARVNHYNADTALKRRQLEMGADDNLAKSSLMGAGLGTDQLEAFKQFLIGGKVDAPAPELSPALAPQTSSPIPPEMRAPTAKLEDQPRFAAARSMVAALRNALMAGDSNSLNPTKAAHLNQTAAGDGNDAVSLAALLSHGKTQYDPSANGVTNLLNGEQALNKYGESQIRANDANVTAREASANNSNVKAKTGGGGGGTALEKNARLLISTGMAADMQDAIKKLNGRSVKTDGLGNIILVDKYDNSITSVSGNGKQKTLVEGETMPPPRQAKKSSPEFKSVADAESAAKSGKIKVGDKIIIGGKSGTWR